MSTWPELELGSHLVRGLAAVALFVVMAVAFVGAPFGAPAGFEGEPNITASIGYAMFNIASDAEGLVGSEGFLVAFEIIDLVLVAALAAAVLLARRESGGQVVSRLVADGGRELKRTLVGDGGDDDAADRTRETPGGER